MDKLLTVVVPVYKVEKYIKKCLDSLIVPNELMERLEVIVVNDGTPDNSAEIAREYEKHYPQTFRLIDKENGGHGSAWNKGLKEAKGKYLRFLDSDDWFDTNNFISLIKKLENCSADIVFADMNFYYEKSNSYQRLSYPNLVEGQVYDAETFDWNLLGGGEEKTNFHHCTYKTMMLKSLSPLFLEKQSYDDAILFVAPIIMSKSLVYFPGVIYNYLIGRDGQTMSKGIMQKKYKDMENVIKSQILMIKNNRVKSLTKDEKLSDIVSTMIMKHWKRLSLLPYNISSNELIRWANYINSEWPNHKNSKLMFLYQKIPFRFYWFVCKLFFS
jgi:glycosyltransferase involved in cell wall biosynthesis